MTRQLRKTILANNKNEAWIFTKNGKTILALGNNSYLGYDNEGNLVETNGFEYSEALSFGDEILIRLA